MVIPIMINLPTLTCRRGEPVSVVMLRVKDGAEEIYVVRFGDGPGKGYHLGVLFNYVLLDCRDFLILHDHDREQDVHIPNWQMRALIREILRPRTFDNTSFNVRFGAWVDLAVIDRTLPF